MKELLEPYGIIPKQTWKLEGYESINYKIEDDDSEYVLKHYKNKEDEPFVLAESQAVDYLYAKVPFSLPRNVKKNGISLAKYGDQSFARLLPFLKGTFLSDIEYSSVLAYNIGKSAGQIIQGFEGFRNSEIEARRSNWDLKYCLLNEPKIKFISDHSKRKIASYFFDQYAQNVLSEISSLKHGIIHNDLNDNNLLIENNEVTGLIDFGDITYAPVINELAIAMTYFLFNKANLIEVANEMFKGFITLYNATEKEIHLLYYLIAARLCTSVVNSAEAKSKGGDTEYILISEKPAWELLNKWIRLNPIALENKLRVTAGFSKLNMKTGFAVDLRKQNFPESLSLSYKRPIHMTSAAFQYMHDAEGNTFLDAYNNIPHVGHCHPRISKVISDQVRKLNTNTRYHFNQLAAYSEKLLSFFPDNLSKMFLLNSGSAASDLAVRIAMFINQSEDIIVMEHGYHGNSRQGIDISSYKFDGKGGNGKANNIHVLPLAKEYNGKSGEQYADMAIEQIQRILDSGIQPAAYIAEPISGCGGQVPLAPGYLKKLVPFLRANKILVIIDEVQTGFGRLGSHFWGFEMHDIEPDIVILGKPIGNGHPMAAVVCNNEICERFANSESMEFFSSFGGNPVSCAIGLEVLKIIEEERLKANAKEVGDYFLKQMKGLKKDFTQIGDVRGSGLFIGIEMVKEDGLSPDTDLAQLIKNEMRERFILCSTDGPFDNVIKSKPPLCFSKENVDQFVFNFKDILN